MHYFGDETVMSLDQVLNLRPNEVRVLGWVRTYEFLEDEHGVDHEVPEFLEIKQDENEQGFWLVRRNRILDFPNYICEESHRFDTPEEALGAFQTLAQVIIDDLQQK